jgi:hypothetical protein
MVMSRLLQDLGPKATRVISHPDSIDFYRPVHNMLRSELRRSKDTKDWIMGYREISFLFAQA